MEKKNTIKTVIKVTALVLAVAVLVFLSIRYAPEIIRLISNTDKFKEYINSFGAAGILIYILFQMIQVIIVVIPGEIIQIGGGYIYGTFFGSLYTFVGITLGVIVVFVATKLLGFSLIKIFIPKDKLEKFNFLINDPKAEIIMFILFLIPGLPKDALTYIAGLTPVKPIRFFILSSIARLPGIIGSAYIGAKLESESYTAVIVVSVIAAVCFILGVIFQQRIVNFIHNFQNRKTDNPEKTDQTIQIYNETAQEFQNKFMDLKLYQHFFEEFSNFLSPGSTILDLGCGPGNVLKYLAQSKKEYQLTGYDLSPEMIRLAQQNVPAAKLEVRDIRSLSINDESFDAVIASFAIVHLTQKETEEFLKEIKRILKPQGFLYLSYISGNNRSHYEKTEFSGGKELYFHYYSYEFIHQELIKNHFHILKKQDQEYPTDKEVKSIEDFIFARKKEKAIIL